MIITNYTDLQAEIANYIDRTDLTAEIPGFIRLAELRIGRKLRVRDMEARLNLNTVLNQKWYGLPDRYRAMRHFQLNTNPIRDLEYLTPQNYAKKWAGSNTGMPLVYTIVGDEFALGPIPDGIYELEMFSHRKYAYLTDSNPTNWLITDAADVLVYASLIEAALFIKDNEEASKWTLTYDTGINDIVKDNALDRHSGGALMVVPDFNRF